MKKTIGVLILSFFIGSISSFSVNANMLISPMRVAFNERERSAEITLINTSDKKRSYRLEWSEKKALPAGGYKELTENEAKSFPTLSNMVRFSPRQVTLLPGEKQKVKLGLRRPKGLADGEYRSHLRFVALPMQSSAAPKGIMTAKVSMLLGYSIPIVLRKGPMNYNVAVEDVKVESSVFNGNSKYSLTVAMTRSGSSSIYGSLFAYWTPSNSEKEIRVGELNSFSFYPELTRTIKKIVWQFPDIPPVNGKLRVTYEGSKEFYDETFFEKNFNL